MTSDIGMTTPTLSDDEHIDDAEPVTAAAAAAARHKVHWDLERGMSLQGAMDARDVTREEEDASHQKNTRQRREQRNRKGSEEWGKGRVEVTNEIDRLDEHEAREERLRRKRREERRKREKAREKERIRDEEAALEEEETSSLDDSPAPKREPKHAPHDVETDISTAARDMDSSADEGTPDAAPGPAPATGFTEKHQQDTETGEMEMTMHVSNGGEDAGDLEEMQNEDGEAGGKVRRRKKGVVASLLGTKSRNSGNDENESTTEDRGPRRARRRPSLKILRKRRRWEEGALFARSVKDAGTTDSSGSGSESNDSHSVSSEDTDTSDGDTSREDERRHRLHWIKDNDNRRHYPTGKRVDAYNPQAPRGLAAMKEDLNEPYIPAYRSGHTDPTNPGSSLKLNQYWDSALRFARLRSRGMSFREAEEKGVQTGQYRTIAALIIATSGLVGPAAPRLAHLAPASGRDAETSKGQRKLAEYTNPREKSARMIMDMTEDARAEAQEMGVPLDSKEKVDLANEALMKVDKERGKGKPLRGRRHQRRFKITKHISDVMERQEFIEHLAKALINFGAPAHSIETWLEATSDILEVSEFSFHSHELLADFLRRPKGGLDLYRLALVHKVYRKVVHDEISVRQGSRSIKRIVKEAS
ncbi:hypothetical protein QFC19_000119 [Naganishia cerealis]|uniref:Uncharacterized protein n=1 Tax=Naganishia cerealis TaxID=610337 RepID=A0ACC2WRY9_9TREE|nr:hypothetical protein QFC19_000119 [Naganishia cerealis]